MKLSDALLYGTRVLEAAGIYEARSDAALLLEACVDVDLSNRFILTDIETDEAAYDKFVTYLNRRCKREPVQYITGRAYFMGHSFYVNRSVLIPRFDTEILADAVIKSASPGMSVLDLCTGSGCIIISIAKAVKKLSCTGSDISKKALEVAEINAKRLGAEVSFVKSDLFDDINDRYDIIVSNPPYISREDMHTLDVEVGEHEPHSALYGGENGLDYYRRIVSEAAGFLNDGGRLFMELGYDSFDAVYAMLDSVGYKDINYIKDLSGIKRVIYAGKGNAGEAYE